ncbi:hypothetical protein SDC9_195591 [bioreactor metagenome]|uniref:Uncharacterized protein n=1 Tax=bioreactor metagenome TaxID=1076179 RepID=A0A645I9G9_9ZZZZ
MGDPPAEHGAGGVLLIKMGGVKVPGHPGKQIHVRFADGLCRAGTLARRKLIDVQAFYDPILLSVHFYQ